jgi:tetratricopeptide (TPR) repeat protein
LVRASSVYYSQQAQAQADIEQALPIYETAFWLDDENPTAHFALGMNYLTAARYAEAVPQFRQSIQAQRATSPDFSYLATAQILAGDPAGAEQTIAEALRLYPLSTFMRARYAALLKENGKLRESDEQLQIALQINPKEANTWWTMMTEGARKASLSAAQNDYTTVMKLNPIPAIYAVVTEREIRFPDEKFKINLGD